MNVKLLISLALVALNSDLCAMQKRQPVQQKETIIAPKQKGHDRAIKQIIIKTKDKKLPNFQRLFIMPYTAGPLRGIQEVAGTTVNGIQDYSVTLQQAKKWQPGDDLIINLEKPVIMNVTTHKPEVLISIEWAELNQQGKSWKFKNKEIDKAAEFNALIIDLSEEKVENQATLGNEEKVSSSH